MSSFTVGILKKCYIFMENFALQLKMKILLFKKSKNYLAHYIE